MHSHTGELRVQAVIHAQRPGDDVLLGVMLGFLHGDGAAVHQLLHIGVIVGELREAAVPEQIGTGVTCVAQIGFAGAHQCAHRRGAHTGQRLFPDGLLEHKTVGADQRPFEKELFLSGQTFVVVLLKTALDHIACALGCFPAAACAAHAVAHQGPSRIPGQLPGTVIVLIVLPDKPDVRFSCKFHRLLPLLCLPVHFIAAQLAAGGADLAAQTAADCSVDA